MPPDLAAVLGEWREGDPPDRLRDALFLVHHLLDLVERRAGLRDPLAFGADFQLDLDGEHGARLVRTLDVLQLSVSQLESWAGERWSS